MSETRARIRMRSTGHCSNRTCIRLMYCTHMVVLALPPAIYCSVSTRVHRMAKRHLHSLEHAMQQMTFGKKQYIQHTNRCTPNCMLVCTAIAALAVTLFPLSITAADYCTIQIQSGLNNPLGDDCARESCAHRF